MTDDLKDRVLEIVAITKFEFRRFRDGHAAACAA